MTRTPPRPARCADQNKVLGDELFAPDRAPTQLRRGSGRQRPSAWRT